jgi:hypothetical protein
MLATSIDIRFESSRSMTHQDSTVSLVPVLTTFSRTSRGEGFDIAVEQGKRTWFFRFENRHSDCGSLNPTLAFSGWNTLPAVTASFVQEWLHERTGALQLEDE